MATNLIPISSQYVTFRTEKINGESKVFVIIDQAGIPQGTKNVNLKITYIADSAFTPEESTKEENIPIYNITFSSESNPVNGMIITNNGIKIVIFILIL